MSFDPMQWAIYYVHPTTGVSYPCISSASHQFGPPGEDPALFANRENAIRAIYNLAKEHQKRVEYYAKRYPDEPPPEPRQPYFRDENRDSIDLPLELDYRNWHVVPVRVEPNFCSPDATSNVITPKQQKHLGII